MNTALDSIISEIEKQYDGKIQKGSRHYLEANLAEQARKLGFADLKDTVKTACAIVPLREPQRGMKVRIDGRTFVNYAQYDSGIAVPGYLAKTGRRPFQTFVPNDSMICNFC